MCNCEKEKRATTLLQESVSTQIQIQAEKLGRRQLMQQIGGAAKKAMSQLPGDCEVEKLDAVSRRYLERVTHLIQSGLSASKWDDAEIVRFTGEMAWAQLSTDIISTVIQRDNADSGGDSGDTCVTRCRKEYEKCVGPTENDCDTGGWGCLCCVPCSLQYMGCVAGCVASIVGIGIRIA